MRTTKFISLFEWLVYISNCWIERFNLQNNWYYYWIQILCKNMAGMMMNDTKTEDILDCKQNFLIQFIKNYGWILLFFIIGFGSIVFSFGKNFLRVPGDLGDARFNNYILEHFYQRIIQRAPDYWNAPMFYPYPLATAFSDNLLGSAPFYTAIRIFGFSRETAFQGWFLFGFVLNYIVSAYVLKKVKLQSISVATGAFLFTFGLPMLAQEGHPQLIYRFCIPAACYFLYDFSDKPKLKTVFFLMAAIIWQFYLTIYMGFFLLLLIVVMVFMIPLSDSSINIIKFWFVRIRSAWNHSRGSQKVWLITGLILLAATLLQLFLPYLQVTKLYHFSRGSDEIKTMLPRLSSYLLSDNSALWRLGRNNFKDLPMRHEHQLFPGLAAASLLLIGLLWKKTDEKIPFLQIHATSLLIIFFITFSVNEKSLYFLLLKIPGYNSIRAVTRIQLVLLWPLAVYIAFVTDRIVRLNSSIFRIKAALGLILVLMISESVFFSHSTYSKIEGQKRVDSLRKIAEYSLKKAKKPDPVLLIHGKAGDPWQITALDAMLTAQELGVPLINGYSGNAPEFSFAEWMHSCQTLPGSVDFYIEKANEFLHDPELKLKERIVYVRYAECGL